MNDTLNQYLHEVKRLLPCSSSEKKRCIAELEADISSFLEKCPQATPEELYSAVGSPQSIAASFMVRLDPKELSRRLSAKRKIVIGVISIAIVLAVVVGTLSAVTAYKCQNFYDGYFVETFDVPPDDVEPAPSALSTY